MRRPNSYPHHRFPSEAVRLDEASIEAIANRVVELMSGTRQRGSGALVDVKELAARLGVSTDFVYRHADDLGARPLGNGPKARLRFDLEEAERAFTRSASRRSEQPAIPVRRPRRARRRRPPTGTDRCLVPVEGRQDRRAA